MTAADWAAVIVLLALAAVAVAIRIRAARDRLGEIDREFGQRDDEDGGS